MMHASLCYSDCAFLKAAKEGPYTSAHVSIQIVLTAETLQRYTSRLESPAGTRFGPDFTLFLESSATLLMQ